MESNKEQLSELDKMLLPIIQAFKPDILKDGDQWCCIYGENPQEGIVGYGVNPMNAVYNFYLSLYEK